MLLSLLNDGSNHTDGNIEYICDLSISHNTVMRVNYYKFLVRVPLPSPFSRTSQKISLRQPLKLLVFVLGMLWLVGRNLQINNLDRIQFADYKNFGVKSDGEKKKNEDKKIRLTCFDWNLESSECKWFYCQNESTLKGKHVIHSMAPNAWYLNLNIAKERQNSVNNIYILLFLFKVFGFYGIIDLMRGRNT